jgi:hypothetical protein
MYILSTHARRFTLILQSFLSMTTPVTRGGVNLMNQVVPPVKKTWSLSENLQRKQFVEACILVIVLSEDGTALVTMINSVNNVDDPVRNPFTSADFGGKDGLRFSVKQDTPLYALALQNACICLVRDVNLPLGKDPMLTGDAIKQMDSATGTLHDYLRKKQYSGNVTVLASDLKRSIQTAYVVVSSLLSRNPDENAVKDYKVNVSKLVHLFPCIHALGLNQSDGDITTWKGFGVMNPQNTSVYREKTGDLVDNLVEVNRNTPDSNNPTNNEIVTPFSALRHGYNLITLNDDFYKQMYADNSFHCRNTNLFQLLLQFQSHDGTTGKKLLVALQQDSSVHDFDKVEIEKIYNAMMVEKTPKESYEATLRTFNKGQPSQRRLVSYMLANIPKATKKSWFGGKTKRRKLKKTRAKSRARR